MLVLLLSVLIAQSVSQHLTANHNASLANVSSLANATLFNATVNWSSTTLQLLGANLSTTSTLSVYTGEPNFNISEAHQDDMVIVVGFVEFPAAGITLHQAQTSVEAALCAQLNVTADWVDITSVQYGNAGQYGLTEEAEDGNNSNNTANVVVVNGSSDSSDTANSSDRSATGDSSNISASGKSLRRLRSDRELQGNGGVTTWLVQYAAAVPQENVLLIQGLAQSTSTSVAAFEQTLQKELHANGANAPPNFAILYQNLQVPPTTTTLFQTTTTTNPFVQLTGSVQFLATGISQGQARAAAVSILSSQLSFPSSAFQSVTVQNVPYNLTQPCAGNAAQSCNTTYPTWLVSYNLQLLPGPASQVQSKASTLLQSQGFFTQQLRDKLKVGGASVPPNFFIANFVVPVQSNIATALPMLTLSGSFSFLAAAITQDQAFAASISAIMQGLNVNASSIQSIVVLPYSAQVTFVNGQLVQASRLLQVQPPTPSPPGQPCTSANSLGCTNITVQMWQVQYSLLVLYQDVSAVQNSAQLYNGSTSGFQTILTNSLISIGAFVPSNFYVAQFTPIVVADAMAATTTPPPAVAYGQSPPSPDELCFFGCRPRAQGLVVVAIFLSIVVGFLILCALGFLYWKGFVQIDFGWDHESKDELELRRLEDERWQLAEAVAGQEEPPFKVPEAWTGYSASKVGGGAGRKYRLNFLNGGKVEGTSQVFSRFFNLQGAYDLQDGHVAWREEAMPEVWERSCNIFEFAGTIRVRRVKGPEDAGHEKEADDFGWVNLREYDPLVPFDGDGYYVHEIVGEVTAFSNEGKTEIIAQERLQIRTEASWAPPPGDGLKLPGKKKLLSMFGYK